MFAIRSTLGSLPQVAVDTEVSLISGKCWPICRRQGVPPVTSLTASRAIHSEHVEQSQIPVYSDGERRARQETSKGIPREAALYCAEQPCFRARFSIVSIFCSAFSLLGCGGDVCPDFSRTPFTAASVAKRNHQLRELPQIRRRGQTQVPGMPHRDCLSTIVAQGPSRQLQHSSRIEPGVRPMSLGAQRRKLSAHQVGHQNLQSQRCRLRA